MYSFIKIVNVGRRHGATRSTNSMDLTREKADINFENANWCE